MSNPLNRLSRVLEQCMLAEQSGFRRRLRRLRERHGKGEPIERAVVDLEALMSASRERRERRAAGLPSMVLDENLPVIQRREDILDAIQDNQVTVISGETGSGKSTQIPKLCLQLGRGAGGLIGQTQPRRIAARSIAERLSEELGSPPGQTVGYKVRFSERLNPEAYIKVMTDGILLAEVQHERRLSAYDTIIIDEAHERSLNIDFLLGYLHQLLPRRPDLKLIITSATIDAERFSRHFHDAPIIEVSGRTYPVETRYRPLAGESGDERDRGMQQAIVEAVDELAVVGPGDVLVFLSGEREIRDTAESLRKHHPPSTEILPLYARLSAAEQRRVFQAHGRRRIVLATNVAETSLTVPGIRYVVDTGLARISRYSSRSKVQRLPIEPVSQASANQRKGRCGRVSAGVCIRLYGEEDFAGRPEFTEPEVRRTNLASVILQMKALDLGEVADFPFLQPPEQRYITDGLRLLHELGAVGENDRLTRIGRQLARLPIDPRLGRMLLAAVEQDCLQEAVVIVAALSIMEPRERPQDRQQQADESHAEFDDPRSDFLAYLKIWEFYQEQSRQLSRNQLQKLCKRRFLSPLRMREWNEVYHQILGLLKGMGFKLNAAPADYAPLHKALLSGLLGQIGFLDEEGVYIGARNSRFRIFPGSGLGKRRPKWVMSASLVETSRLYARVVAAIEPEWVEPLARHLVKRGYSEPHWVVRRGQVVAFEKVSLYGLPVVARRKVHFGPVDAPESRRIFIREALVTGDIHGNFAFLAHNRQLVAEIEALEHKSRRHDVLVDEQRLFDFYDACLPARVVGTAALEKWLRQAGADESGRLFMQREAIMRHAAGTVTEEVYPEYLSLAGLKLPLRYLFDPAREADGITVEIPLAALHMLTPEPFEWLVPGLVEEKLVQLIKTLPKALRRNFVPAPDFARAALEAIPRRDSALLQALSTQLVRMTGVPVPEEAWQPERLPAHLRLRFEVRDGDEVVDADRDLAALQSRWREQANSRMQAVENPDYPKTGCTDWDFGDLPESVALQQGGVTLQGFPTLVDAGETVNVELRNSIQDSRREGRAGLRRLYMLQLPRQRKDLLRLIPDLNGLCLKYRTVGDCQELKDGLLGAVFEQVFVAPAVDIRTREAFAAQLEAGRPRLFDEMQRQVNAITDILGRHQVVKRNLARSGAIDRLDSIRDMEEQLARLVYPGFLLATPVDGLQQLPRYLKALELRLQKLADKTDRDRSATRGLRPLWEAFWAQLGEPDGVRWRDADWQAHRWMLEEWRVSLFAQELGTRQSVSEKRIKKAWDTLRKGA